MQSPNCVSQTLMMTVRQHVEVDHCPESGGVWELDASGVSRAHDDRKEGERKEAPGRKEYEKGDILEDDEDDDEDKRRDPSEDDDDVLRTGPARDREASGTDIIEAMKRPRGDHEQTGLKS